MQPASRALRLWAPLRQVHRSPAAAASPLRTFSAPRIAYMLCALQHIHHNAVQGKAHDIKHGVGQYTRLCGRQAVSKMLGMHTSYIHALTLTQT